MSDTLLATDLALLPASPGETLQEEIDRVLAAAATQYAASGALSQSTHEESVLLINRLGIIFAAKLGAAMGGAGGDAETLTGQTNADVTITSSGTGKVTINSGAIASQTAKVGFYGTTPISKQTGVAVSAAGIHAALVALGLIAA